MSICDKCVFLRPLSRRGKTLACWYTEDTGMELYGDEFDDDLCSGFIEIKTDKPQITHYADQHTLERLAKLEAVAEAANYWLFKATRPGGQANGKLSCGHDGKLGAPMCKNCLRQALAELDKEITNE